MDGKIIKSIIPELKFDFPYDLVDYINKPVMTNYHKHSDLSNLYTTVDSPVSLEDYAKRTVELGQHCLSNVEHGFQGQQFFGNDIAHKYGLKCLFGTEAYWVRNRKEKDNTNAHMIIMATDEEGRQELNYMLSIANEDGWYYKPRIDLELLGNLNPEHFIVTSACVAFWKVNDVDQVVKWLHDKFKDRFFLEVQYHNTDSQKELNKHIIDMSNKEDIDIICGLDSHFILPEESVKRDELLRYKHITYEDEKGWYLDYPDIDTVINRFREQGILNEEQITRSILNTLIFDSSVVDNIELSKDFKVPTLYPEKTIDERNKILRKILNEAYKKEPNKTKEKVQGIRYEENEIEKSNMADYFITSHAIIDRAVNKYGTILTKTGRGSNASYYINYLLGLTTIDRFNIPGGLFPERFLTAERVNNSHQMADEDLNLSSPDGCLQAARDLLGDDSTYPLLALDKLKTKAAFQLYASNHGIKPSTADVISGYISEYEKALKHADDDEKYQIKISEYIPEQYLGIFEESKSYQQIIMGARVHPCGHIVYSEPCGVKRMIGLMSVKAQGNKGRTLVAAVEGQYLDSYGFCKLDWLRVDTVKLINLMYKEIGMEVPSTNELLHMIDGDDKTFDVISSGCTYGIDQLTKEGTRQKAIKYSPRTLQELSSFIAAIRPGMASLVNDFIHRRSFSTGEPKIDALLVQNNGYFLFQEDIMHVLNYLGLSMAETYGVIKKISKKHMTSETKQNLLNRLKNGWLTKIGNLDNFDKVWNILEAATSYSFNKSHSYAYAYTSLYELYIKGHYPDVFYHVYINFYQDKEDKEKISSLIEEARKYYGYTVQNAVFGQDNRHTLVDGKAKVIIPSLSSIKGVGIPVGEKLYELGMKQYNSFYDVLKAISKASVNSTVITNLIKIGYFKKYGHRKLLLKEQEWFSLFKNGEAKSMSKEKAAENRIPISILTLHSKETEKQYTKLDSQAILEDLANTDIDLSLSRKEKLQYELSVLDSCVSIFEDVSPKEFCVTSIDDNRKVVKLKIYQLKTGKTYDCKMWERLYMDFHVYVPNLQKGDLIYIQNIDKKNKVEFTGETDEYGKRIYKPVPDKYEYWITNYKIL